MAAMGDGPAHREMPPPFGIYVHVPYCAARCGYCDFNTYVGRSTDGFAATVGAEIRLARERLGPRSVATVFLGGGTPTLLAPSDLAEILDAVDDAFGLEPGAEVTVEANPETVDRRTFAELRAAGVSRVSLGMQSAVAGVLATLDRRHTPGLAVAAAREARAAGLEHVSLDLIYGTPGETDADWRASLDAVLAAGTDHVSAYALTVQPGTRMAARVRRGELVDQGDGGVLSHSPRDRSFAAFRPEPTRPCLSARTRTAVTASRVR